eukprot:362920-Chlamydomonas_euryale.AAC.3
MSMLCASEWCVHAYAYAATHSERDGHSSPVCTPAETGCDTFLLGSNFSTSAHAPQKAFAAVRHCQSLQLSSPPRQAAVWLLPLPRMCEEICLRALMSRCICCTHIFVGVTYATISPANQPDYAAQAQDINYHVADLLRSARSLRTRCAVLARCGLAADSLRSARSLQTRCAALAR